MHTGRCSGHLSCHARHLPHMPPPATHASTCHAHPLPCTPPLHACPLPRMPPRHARPPPVNRMTDTCKNITLLQLAVITKYAKMSVLREKIWLFGLCMCVGGGGGVGAGSGADLRYPDLMSRRKFKFLGLWAERDKWWAVGDFDHIFVRAVSAVDHT